MLGSQNQISSSNSCFVVVFVSTSIVQ